MALYGKMVNLWTLNAEQRRNLQPGQWVTAGESGPTGRWAGQRVNSHVEAVSWQRTHQDFAMKRQYVKGERASKYLFG